MEKQQFNKMEFLRKVNADLQKRIEQKQAYLKAAEEQQRKERLINNGYSEYSDLTEEL